METVKDLTGKRFGNLVVISLVLPKTTHNYRWECICDCGTIKDIVGGSLVRGTTKSCGCLRASMVSEKNTKHGMSSLPEYANWQAMKTRCLNPNTKIYKHYGGRGITICTEWLDDFEQFFKDLGQKPSEKHTLERIDNEKGYCAENCKWATFTEQANNRRPRAISKNNRSGTTGISIEKGRYVARFKGKYLGMSNDLETAVSLRKQAEQREAQ